MSVKALAESHENCYNIIPPNVDKPHSHSVLHDAITTIQAFSLFIGESIIITIRRCNRVACIGYMGRGSRNNQA